MREFPVEVDVDVQITAASIVWRHVEHQHSGFPVFKQGTRIQDGVVKHIDRRNRQPTDFSDKIGPIRPEKRETDVRRPPGLAPSIIATIRSIPSEVCAEVLLMTEGATWVHF